MSSLTVAAAVLAAVGAALLLLALARLRRRRIFAAGGHGLGGACALAVGGLLGAVALNLHTYQRLTHERDVAEIAFRALEPQRYQAEVHLTGEDRVRRYVLLGDEWQIDARLLKWHGVANLLGLDARYRIDRLGGRYADVGEERSAPRSVYALGEGAGLDLWALARRWERWLPIVDARYGSAAFLPMSDGARFRVTVSQSGLVARPLNEAGRTAIEGWRR